MRDRKETLKTPHKHYEPVDSQPRSEGFFWMILGRGPQPVKMHHVASTENSPTWLSDDGLAVDFVMCLFIGWAISRPSVGAVRRLASQNEWGVWGGERWDLCPSSGQLSHLQPGGLPCHYSSVAWLGANQIHAIWTTSKSCTFSWGENVLRWRARTQRTTRGDLKLTKP